MDFHDSKPIFQQVGDRICDEILQGVYVEDERIPSVREYSAIVEVNVNTAMRSFDLLQQQEILYNKRGIGYFVAIGARDKILTNRRNEFINKQIPLFVNEMKKLNISIEQFMEAYNKADE